MGPKKEGKKPAAAASSSAAKDKENVKKDKPTPKKEVKPKVEKAPKEKREKTRSKPSKDKKAVKPITKRKQVDKQRKHVAIKKALKAGKKVIKSVEGERKRVRKVRTSVHFKRPKTFRPPRQPKYPRKSIPRRNRMDAYNIIQYPLTTEAAMKKIEDNNTLVFIVHLKSNKFHISAAVKKKLYEVDVASVNTLIRPDGKKEGLCTTCTRF